MIHVLTTCLSYNVFKIDIVPILVILNLFTNMPVLCSKDPLKTPESWDEDKQQVDSSNLSIISFGIGATIGVIIGFIMLLFGCGVACHYCCGSRNNVRYTRPVVTQRPPSGRSTWVSVPVSSRRNASLINITITSHPMSSVNQIDDDPPDYDEVTATSFPVYQKPEDVQLNSSDLPSYATATANL